MRTLVRRSIGMARVAGHLAKGAAILVLVFPLVSPTRRRRIVQAWSGKVLRIFGLDLAHHGALPASAASAAGAGPVLLAGNHISWIDIYAYLTVADVRFVAKSEVRSWPLIGWFARSLGTIFVERDRPRDALRVANEIRTALQAGQVVCVFPEGTTTDGTVVLPFSAALLNPAVELKAHAVPVSIAYRDATGAPCARMAFTGDATLLASIWALAGGERSHVELRFLDPVDAATCDRRALARRLENAVRESLGHEPRQVTTSTTDKSAPDRPIAA